MHRNKAKDRWEARGYYGLIGWDILSIEYIEGRDEFRLVVARDNNPEDQRIVYAELEAVPESIIKKMK